MIQLNSELKEIFSTLGSLIPKDLIEEYKGEENLLYFSIKTPNLFYKEYKFFINEINVTEKIKDIKEVKSLISQAYFNYFVHYHEQINFPYYQIVFEVEFSSSENYKLNPNLINKLNSL